MFRDKTSRFLKNLNRLFFLYFKFSDTECFVPQRVDLLAILQKSLDREIFLYNFIREARLSGVRASIAIDLFKEVWDGAFLFWKMADTRESSPRC